MLFAAFRVLLLLLLAAPVSALTILDDQRSISVYGFSSCGITSCSQSDSDEVVYDGSSPTFQTGRSALGGYTGQFSEVGADFVTATGTTRSNEAVDILEVDASSQIEVVFSITEATTFALFGFVETTRGWHWRGTATATVRLSDASGDLYLFDAAHAGSGIDSTLPDRIVVREDFSESFVLAPGTYTLFAQAFQDTAEFRTADFRFTFTTPEPSTALLLAFGLAGLAGRRAARRLAAA